MSIPSSTSQNWLLRTKTSTMGAVGTYLSLEDLNNGLRVSKIYLSTILSSKISLKISDPIKPAINLVKALNTRGYSLVHLSIYEIVTKTGLTDIIKVCAGLKKLSFVKCTKLTDENLQVIAINCPNLKTLSLINCFQTPEKSLEILSDCKDLYILIVAYCTNRVLSTKSFREKKLPPGDLRG